MTAFVTFVVTIFFILYVFQIVVIIAILGEKSPSKDDFQFKSKQQIYLSLIPFMRVFYILKYAVTDWLGEELTKLKEFKNTIDEKFRRLEEK
jgi:hypothetical protein